MRVKSARGRGKTKKYFLVEKLQLAFHSDFFFLNYEACITSVYLEHIQCLDLILFVLWGTSKETFRSTA